jgi:hypothetical protein
MGPNNSFVKEGQQEEKQCLTKGWQGQPSYHAASMLN